MFLLKTVALFKINKSWAKINNPISLSLQYPPFPPLSSLPPPSIFPLPFSLLPSLSSLLPRYNSRVHPHQRPLPYVTSSQSLRQTRPNPLDHIQTCERQKQNNRHTCSSLSSSIPPLPVHILSSLHYPPSLPYPSHLSTAVSYNTCAKSWVASSVSPPSTLCNNSFIRGWRGLISRVFFWFM